jgi:hypothetical protein
VAAAEHVKLFNSRELQRIARLTWQDRAADNAVGLQPKPDCAPMTLPADQVRHWIASFVDRTGAQLRAELDVLVGQVQDAALTAEQTVRSAAAGSAEPETLAEAVAAARTEERQPDLATAASVLEGMTALDSAHSLSGIMDTLVDQAAVHAGRVLLVIRRQEALTGWRWRGYTPDPRDASMLAIPLADPGLVARAATTGATETGSGPAAGDPAVGSNAENRAAIAIPLCVDGAVVAVLYADENGDAEHVVPSSWPQVVEVLARHAARCLESLTARRLPVLVRALAERDPVLPGVRA